MGAGYRAGLGQKIKMPRVVTRGRNAIFEGSNLARLAQYLSLPGIAGNYASTPDSAAVSIVGDIDIRVKVAPNDWTAAGYQTFVSKWRNDLGSLSYRFEISPTGLLYFGSTADFLTERGVESTESVSFINGEHGWVRVTRSASTGDVTFYTSSDGIDWTQLGVSIATTIEGIADNNFAVEIGSYSNGVADILAGAFYYAEVRNGIDGPIVACFDPTRALTNQREIQSITGEVWTINTSGDGQIAQLF